RPSEQQQGSAPETQTASPEEQPSGEAGEIPEAAPRQQEPQAAEKEAGPGGQQADDATGGSQGASGTEGGLASAPSRQMSPEEAERWLNTLDEDQKELARRQAQEAAGRGERRPSKDW
ncbi:MAG: hypothetical protein AB1640_23160, partial [bacterium]